MIRINPEAGRIAALALSNRIYTLDGSRPKGWHLQDTDCSLTKADARYRAELDAAYIELSTALNNFYGVQS